VKDPDDGVLQYIWDLAKVVLSPQRHDQRHDTTRHVWSGLTNALEQGHTLGMVGSDAFGLLMGRFAAHNRMALAEEVYAHILNYRQASTDNDVRPVSPL
jgi:hypothetical protein